MWTKTFSKFYPNVSAKKIWDLWVDINNWPQHHTDLEYCKFDGRFEVGNHFILKPKDFKPVKIVLTEIEEGIRFTDCTTFPGAKMYDTHILEKKSNGVVIGNIIKVTGPLQHLWVKLVAQKVANSIEHKVDELVKLAKHNNTITKTPFGFEKPKDSPGFLLWQTTISWQKLIKQAIEPYEISHSQFVIMALAFWLEKHQYDATQITIANWSKLDKMTVSKSLKELVKKGLVERISHKIDTRAKVILLTDTGKALIYKLVPIVENIDKEFFNKLSENNQEYLLQLLQQLNPS